MSKITDSKTFCPHMWLSATHSNGGFFKPCCVYYQNDHNNKWGIGFDKNSDLLSQQRKMLANSERPDSCKWCWSYEDQGLESLRTESLALDWWQPYKDHINAHTDLSTGVYHHEPVYFDLKLGNKCNLACRMCSPESSSLIEKEVDDNQSLFEYHPYALDDLKFVKKHFTDDQRIDMVFDAIKSIDDMVEIKFTGGEPFLNQRIPEFIDHCISQGIADRIKIHFTSNLTVLPDRLLEKLKHFKWSCVNVSMEGIESTYEYIRYPSTWSKFLKNWNKLMSSKIHTHVIYSVNSLVICDMPEWLSWIESQRVSWAPNPVMDPPWYHTKVIPQTLKHTINQQLTGRSRDVDGILKMMNMDHDLDLWQLLIKDTRVKDGLRNQSIHKSIPKIATFM